MARANSAKSSKSPTSSAVASKPVAPSVPTAEPITREKIAMRAYEKWMGRGCPEGTALQDWMEAEAELKSVAPPPATAQAAPSAASSAASSAAKSSSPASKRR